jgi:predicted transcriptional regulator
MSGLDHFLSQSLESELKKNLGKEAIRKIEKRIFEKHGLSFTQSIKEFQKLDSVLREFFGAGADGIEEECFKNICSLKNNIDNNKKRTKPTKWIIIKDPILTESILDVVGDSDKKRIFESVMDESKTVYDIISECNIPQTSGYRKINSLIKNGLLSISGHIETHDGKKVNKYKSIFQNMRINIIKNEITISIQLNGQNVADSSILLAMTEL